MVIAVAFSRTASVALWKRRLTYRETQLAKARKTGHAKPGTTVTKPEAARIHKWERNVSEARKKLAYHQAKQAEGRPLRLRALEEMSKLVGIMEVGGNNQGRAVMEIIRANDGTGPEPWCGDTVAFAYRKAGSKVVQRGWAAVRLLGFLAGMTRVASPLPGDIVAYEFDHTGLFEKWTDRASGEFQAIEGNTGASGAVSDSSTGGDGVYRKRRNANQVARWVRVAR